MRQSDRETKRGITLRARIRGIQQRRDIAVLGRHGSSDRGRNLPVKDIQRPPEIPAAGDSLRAEFIFRELGMHSIHLGNADCVSDLSHNQYKVDHKRRQTHVNMG